MKKPRRGRVYTITNTVTGRVYVGATMKGVMTRWGGHRTLLREGKHTSATMQADWNAYGESSFDAVVIETLPDTSDLAEREAAWTYDLMDRGVSLYNNRLPRTHCRACGQKLPAELRLQASNASWTEAARYP